MWRTAMLGSLLIGCGAAAGTTETAQNTEAEAASADHLARLGCDPITSDQLDRFVAEDPELRLIGEGRGDVALTLLAEVPGLREAGEIRRDVALSLLVRRLAVARLAEEAHLEVEEAEIDQAIAHLAAVAQRPVEDLYREVDARHLDRVAYRGIIRDQLLSMRAANTLWGAGFAPPPEPGMSREESAAVLDDCLDRYVAGLLAMPIEETQEGCFELAGVSP